jgi:23S rRNA (adenine2503-C2)-methyltransferase
MEILRSKEFTNGCVYCLELDDKKLVETTDTYLPFYTKNAIAIATQSEIENGAACGQLSIITD